MTYQGIPVREHVCSLDGGGEVLIREWQGGRVEAAWRPNPDAVLYCSNCGQGRA